MPVEPCRDAEAVQPLASLPMPARDVHQPFGDSHSPFEAQFPEVLQSGMPVQTRALRTAGPS